MGLNDSFAVFPPKGDHANDSTGPVRKPEDTRPLSLKNADNKTIAGITNCALSPKIATWADESQRGFVTGRNGLDNVVDLDSASRRLDLLATPGLIPILVFWDFAAAFPSIAHEYLMSCLRAAGLPAGFLNLVAAIYERCEVYLNNEGLVICPRRCVARMPALRHLVCDRH